MTTARDLPAPEGPPLMSTAPIRPVCRIEFGKVGDTRPVPALTLGGLDDTAFVRAVTEHAIPYLRPVLEASGHPEFADCVFVPTDDWTGGQFLWLDLAGGQGARFCGVRITTVAGA